MHTFNLICLSFFTILMACLIYNETYNFSRIQLMLEIMAFKLKKIPKDYHWLPLFTGLRVEKCRIRLSQLLVSLCGRREFY